jgi:hypothetical protein
VLAANLSILVNIRLCESHVTEVPLIDIGISIGVLVLVIPVALWASAKLFRAGMLLHGQRPGFQQIIHILRQT